MKSVAVFLSMITLVGCAAKTVLEPEEVVLEIGFSGGCAMGGRPCPRYVIYGNGQVEAQLVKQTGVEAIQTENVEAIQTESVEASLVRAAVAEFAARDLNSVAGRFSIECQSPLDGIDAELRIPTEATAMTCIDLMGIAEEVPEFGELIRTMVGAIGEDNTAVLRHFLQLDT